MPDRSAQPAPHQERARRRLPLPLVIVVALFGAVWTALAVTTIVTGTGSTGGIRLANLIANITGGLLVCGVAWLGSRPRPSVPVTARGLVLVVVVSAIPVVAALIEGVLGRQQHVATSAATDLVAAGVVAVAAVAVYRSRPSP